MLGLLLQTPGKHSETILPIGGHKTVHHPRIFRLYVAVRLNTRLDHIQVDDGLPGQQACQEDVRGS